MQFNSPGSAPHIRGDRGISVAVGRGSHRWQSAVTIFADGFFFVTGRIKELIIKGGENIAPREIDEALLAHPAVLEAAAVGIPDELYGQDILACVVLKPGARCDAAELRAHCHAQLGRYKTPREFRLVAALPKGPSGKVQRLKLLEMRAAADGGGADGGRVGA